MDILGAPNGKGMIPQKSGTIFPFQERMILNHLNQKNMAHWPQLHNRKLKYKQTSGNLKMDP